MAKKILKEKNIDYEERNIQGLEWNKEDLLKVVPDAKTVPQIFIDDEYIGSYEDLIKRIG